MNTHSPAAPVRAVGSAPGEGPCALGCRRVGPSSASAAADEEPFLVSSAAPESAVVAAIRRADRFMLVDGLGREHADGAALDVASEAHAEGDLYTPNYTADPVVTAAGVCGYVDCKGAIEPAMGETMRRILREELRKLGASVHVREHDGT